MPARPASPPATSQTSRMARRVSMPETSASAMLSASARICLPKRAKARARPTAPRRREPDGPEGAQSIDAGNCGERHVVGERANLFAEAREGEGEADRGDGGDADHEHQRLQRSEMERSHIDAAEHILPDAADLAAGEELDRVADHHGEPDGDQKELERARARASH